MSTLVVYDSVFGNTERIAQVIAASVGSQSSVPCIRVETANPSLLLDVDRLLVGSPTRQFRATPAITAWIEALEPAAVARLTVATFDTRVDLNDIRNGFFRWMVGSFGWAADRMANQLKRRGARMLAEPIGFLVADREGPLKSGEEARAVAWARSLPGR